MTIDDTAGRQAPMTDDPWLSEDQQRVWRLYLSASRMLSERIERDMQTRGGLPMAYYLVLAMLSEAPDRRLRMNQLSQLVDFSQSRLSHAVNRLEELGWVRREQATADRRGWLTILTDAGYEHLVQLAPLHAETVRSSMFDPLDSEQLAALESICTTILANARAGDHPVPPVDPSGQPPPPRSTGFRTL